MIKSKKVLSILLTLVIVLAFSVNAFAATPGTVTVQVTANGSNVDSFSYTVGTDTTVYNVIADQYGTDANWSGSYLKGLLGYPSAPYVPVAGSFDEDGEYVGGDATIDTLNALPKFAQYDGVYMSFADMMGDGYFAMGDMQHMCYIGSDWLYQVDYAADGYGNPVYPPNSTSLDDTQYQYTMDECVLSAGDIVILTYGPTPIVF